MTDEEMLSLHIDADVSLLTDLLCDGRDPIQSNSRCLVLPFDCRYHINIIGGNPNSTR